MIGITSKRTKAPILAGAMSGVWTGTEGKGISVRDADESERIEIIVPADGLYEISGYGSYQGIAYEKVDVILHILVEGKEPDPNPYAWRRVIFPDYNFNGLISGSIQLQKHLKKGVIIALGYGNLDKPEPASTKNASFLYGFPGDYLSIQRVPHSLPDSSSNSK